MSLAPPAGGDVVGEGAREMARARRLAAAAVLGEAARVADLVAS